MSGGGRRRAGLWLGWLALWGALSLSLLPLTFTGGSWHDDEGLFLLMAQRYSAGDVPYAETFSFYGPAHYLILDLLELAGVPATHAAWRALLAAELGLAATLLVGLVWRFSARASLALLGFSAAAPFLLDLGQEPGHPHVRGLILAALSLHAALWLARRPGGRGAAALGALAGGLLLLKVNLGAFACGAAALCLLLHTRDLPRWPAWLAALALCLLPLALCARSLSRFGGRAFLLLSAAALLATCAAALARRPGEGALPRRASLEALAGGGLVLALGLSWALAQGSTLGELWRSLVVEASRMGDAFWIDFAYRRRVLLPAGAFSLAAIAGRIAQVRGWAPPPWSSGWGPGLIVAGVAVALSQPEAFYNAAMLATAGLLATAPPASRRCPAFARDYFALFAVLHGLIAFPVGGGQLRLASLVLLAPALLAASEHARRLAPGPRRARWLGAGFALVAALIFPWGALLERGRARAESAALRLPGCEGVRLAPAEAARRHWLVSNLQAAEAPFVAIPGALSLHVWSGIEPPSRQVVSHWFGFLAAAEQEAMVARLERGRGLWIEGNLGDFLRSPAHEELALLRYLRGETFRPWRERLGWRLHARRDAPLAAETLLSDPVAFSGQGGDAYAFPLAALRGEEWTLLLEVRREAGALSLATDEGPWLELGARGDARGWTRVACARRGGRLVVAEGGRLREGPASSASSAWSGAPIAPDAIGWLGRGLKGTLARVRVLRRGLDDEALQRRTR